MSQDSQLRRLVLNKKVFKQIQEILPYKLPKPFPQWKNILEYAVITLDLARKSKANISLISHSVNWQSLILESIPVYCICKNIIKDFELTEIRESEPFFPPNWEPKVPNFMLVLPDSVIKTPDNTNVLYAFVTYFDDIPKDPTWFPKRLMVSLINQKGNIYNSAFGIGEHGEILNRERLLEGSESLSDEEQAFLKNFRALVIQALLCLEYAPEYIDTPTEKKLSTLQKKKIPLNQDWQPRFIGRNYERRLAPTSGVPKQKGEHRSPRRHHRRAFWRSQACGPQHKDRVARWILPTVVNRNAGAD